MICISCFVKSYHASEISVRFVCSFRARGFTYWRRSQREMLTNGSEQRNRASDQSEDEDESPLTSSPMRGSKEAPEATWAAKHYWCPRSVFKSVPSPQDTHSYSVMTPFHSCFDRNRDGIKKKKFLFHIFLKITFWDRIFTMFAFVNGS